MREARSTCAAGRGLERTLRLSMMGDEGNHENEDSDYTKEIFDLEIPILGDVKQQNEDRPSQEGRSATESSVAVGGGAKRASSPARYLPVRTSTPLMPIATLPEASNSASSPTITTSSRLQPASRARLSNSSEEGLPRLTISRPEA